MARPNPTKLVAPYETLQAACLSERTEPLRWLVEGLFIEAGAGILGGAPKSYKSYFALDLCVAVASGTPCASRFKVPTAGPVLLLCAEDPPAVVATRLNALARGRGFALDVLPIDIITDTIELLPEGLDRLVATVHARRPRLLLLDPLIRLHHAEENSASEMSGILDGLRTLARQSRAAVLLVHHSRKAAAATGGTGLRGSSDLHAFGDSNLYLRRLGQEGLLELRLEHRAAATCEPLRLKLEVGENSDTARFCVIAAPSNDGIAGNVLDILKNATTPIPGANLRVKLGIRNQTLIAALNTLHREGLVRRVGRDGWTMTIAHPAH